MTKPKFTGTSEKRSGDAATFTTQPMATTYGWQSTPYPAAGHGRSTGPYKAPPVAATSVDPGRLADFEKGVKESRDASARTALIMAGTYVGVRLLQKHWSSWKQHL